MQQNRDKSVSTNVRENTPAGGDKRRKARWITSSLLFHSTALVGTLAGVPMPFYGRLYTRAYAQASCNPSSTQGYQVSAHHDSSDDFNKSNGNLAGIGPFTCTIASGTVTSTQYAYGGAYMLVYDNGTTSKAQYNGVTYGQTANWAWTSPSLVVNSSATITVTGDTNTALLLDPGYHSGSPLVYARTQSNGLSVVTRGAINWSDDDDNEKTGGGNAGSIAVTSHGAVSSTAGGGILALAKAGTARYADDKNNNANRTAGSVSVASYATVSGSTFGIAALSLGGPGTYTSHKDYAAGGPGGAVTVKSYASVTAGSGPAIIAASYGGNTPDNFNLFNIKYNGDDGYEHDEQYTQAYGADGGAAGSVSITVGNSADPFAGKIVSNNSAQVGWATRYNTFKLTRQTGAGIMAISRGGDGIGRQRQQGIKDYTTTFSGADASGVTVTLTGTSATVINTYGTYSPGIMAVSQGGNSSGYKEENVSGGNGSTVSVTLAGGGAIKTEAAYSGGIIAQSIGGGGQSKKNDVSVGGTADTVTVTTDFAIVTKGDHAHGIVAQSVSATPVGGDYSNSGSGAFVWGNLGATSADSGAVGVYNDGSIKVYGIDAHGIVAQSIGGGGGTLRSTGALPSDSSYAGSPVSSTYYSQTVGGASSGSTAASVTVMNTGAISTYGGYSASGTPASGSSDTSLLGGGIAILAQSIGGGGGTNDGQGAIGAVGGANYASDGAGSDGAAVTVHTSGNLTTLGSEAHGIVAQSIGGGGGQGRNRKGLFHVVGGAGGNGGDGGTVTVQQETGTAITVSGDYASGAIAQSIGGGGGVGGQATAWGVDISSATGGTGGAGGAGGHSKFTQFGSASTLATKGDHGTGILVQSIGGGGGVGGNAKSTSIGLGVGVSISHGGSGATGGDGGTASAYVNGAVTTSGMDAQGLVVQSIGGGGGSGGQASSKAITAGVPIDEEGNTASFSVTVAHGGSGGGGGNGGTAEAHVYETASIATSGDGAAGLVVQSIGGGGGNGGDSTASSVAKSITSWIENDDDGTTGKDFAVSVNVSTGGNAAKGGTGDAVNAYLWGAIGTKGSYADGIVAQSIGGGGGNAGTGTGSTKAAKGISSAALNISMGATGGAGGDAGTVTVGIGDTRASIATTGHVSRGILAQSIGGGGGSSSGSGGMGDADWDLTIGIGARGSAGGDGGTVDVWNQGTITTRGDWADAILAQSVGGGGGAAGSGKSSLSIKEDEDDDDDGGDDDGGDDSQEATSAVSSFAATDSSDDNGDDGDNDDSDDDKTITANVIVGSIGGAGGTGGAITIGLDASNANAVVGTGTIHTYGVMSSGIVAQSIGGGGGAVAVSSGSDDSDDSTSSATASDSSDSTCPTSGATSSSSDSSGDSCVSLTLGSPGGNGGDGGAVTVYASNIYTGGFAANGVVAQSIAGGGGVGFSSGLAVSKVKIKLGGTVGGNAGTAGTVTVDTLSGTSIVTKGDAAQGIIAQSIGGGGGLIGVALGTANAVNDDTIADVLSTTLGSGSNPGTAHGGAVTITHNGTLKTYGTRSVGIVAQSISGGGGFVTAAEAVTDAIAFVQNQAPNSADDVTVDLKQGASIVTSGDGAFGILAQTVSGGGGVAGDLSQPLTATYGYYDATASGTKYYYGQGPADRTGTVSVTVEAGSSISTTGANAHGIVAQAIGGSGGIFTRNGKTYAGTLGRFNNTKNNAAAGNNQSGSLTVEVDGAVSVTDPTAWGVWAQATGETMTLTIGTGGSVSGSKAAATNGVYTGGATYVSAAKKTSIVHSNAGTLTGNVVHHTFDDPASAANGAIQAAALSGTSLFLNQGTGLFVTGGIADVDGLVNAGSIDIGGEWNTIRTTVTGDLVGVGTSDAGSAYDVAELGLSPGFSPFSYFQRSVEKSWRSATSSSGGLLTGLDIDMANGTADTLLVEGDFAGTWGVDVNANAFLPNTRSDFLKIEGTDTSDITMLSSLVFDFTDVSTSAAGWKGFSIDSAHFADSGVSLGRNAGGVSRAMQQAWDRIDDGSAAEVKFAEDEISLGQAFGAFHQSTPETFSDMLLTLASQTAAAPLSNSPSAAIAAANSVLSCPAFETSGVMTDEGSCAWGRVLGGETSQGAHGDASGYTQSVGGLQVGGQMELADGWFLGTGLTYENSWFRNDSGTEKMDQDSFTGAIALKKEIGPWLFGIVGGAGYNWGDSKRYIGLDTLSATARGEPDSAMFFARARASYEFALSDEFYMRPKVDFDVINMHQYAYTETGAGALNLIVDGNTDTAFGVTPGIEFGARVPFLEDMPARLYADLGVTFLTSDEWETTARFAGLSSMDSFSTFSPIADTVGHVSLGLDLARREGMELKLQYDGSFADDYHSHTGSLRFGYRF